jgi:tetratricopeptide (TPR) repeat protein
MTADQWHEIEEVLAAALAMDEDQQTDYLTRVFAGQPQVRAEVQALLSVRQQAHAAFDRTPATNWVAIAAAPAARAGQALGPYQVIEKIGTGGMGEVYLAERNDAQFDRRVAIKMVAASIASAEVLARFHTERQILAKLDHPNIARLLDAGITEAGQPFYIMEYVDGVPLLDFCRKRVLSVPERLQLFRVICSAIHFAHQNLIVHRDLKPSNILVTTNGVPKLLDFGIAKILGPSPDPSAPVTLPNVQPMTPEYASPEQLRGGVITTASDVYSLGALQYELLSGNRPFSFEGLTLEQAASLVTGAAPPKPSGAGGVGRHELEGDLDAIILKALRSDPRERYVSAEDLSVDIGRYLDGLPVLARRGTLHYVARKFIARHLTAVAVAFTAVVLLAAGGVTLVHTARIAEAERAKAQERFDQVRKLANSLLFELHDGVAALPGSNSVRKQLVARALEYLDTLAKTSSGDPVLQLNLAQSYERLGSVQGHISEMNLGDPEGALASYSRGIEILQHVPSAARERTDILRELATLHILRRDVYRDMRKFRERDREYKEAIAIVGPLAERFPNDAAILTLDSTVFFGQAKGRAAEDPEEARQLFLRSLAIDNKLLQAHPYNPIYQRGVALDYKYLSSVDPSHQLALDHLRQAQALDEKRLAARPDNAQARLDLSFDLSETAAHLEQTGELSRALELSWQVQSIRNNLAIADPNDAQLRLRVITAGKAVAGILAKMDKLEAALAEYRAAATRAEAAIAAVPADARNREVLGEVQMGIASTEAQIATRSATSARARHHRQNSCDAYVRAAQVLGSLVAQGIATAEENRLADNAVKAAAACSAP